MKNVLRCLVLATSAFLLVGQASANPCPPGNPPTNCAPPPGAILDLDGTAVPHAYTHYSVNFIATVLNTNISFAFREDPAFLGLDDVSVHLTTGGANLLTNGDFELGVVGNNAPVGWTFLNAFGAAAQGVVATGGTPGAHGGSNYYRDGAVQAYDGITQSVATALASQYTVEFWLDDNGPLNTFSRISTNGNVTGTGGNGIDLLVYAGRIPTITVPEPATLALLGIGLAGIGLSRRRKSS